MTTDTMAPVAETTDESTKAQFAALWAGTKRFVVQTARGCGWQSDRHAIERASDFATYAFLAGWCFLLSAILSWVAGHSSWATWSMSLLFVVNLTVGVIVANMAGRRRDKLIARFEEQPRDDGR